MTPYFLLPGFVLFGGQALGAATQLQPSETRLASEERAPLPPTKPASQPLTPVARVDDIENASPRERQVPPNQSQGPFSGAFYFRNQEQIEQDGRNRVFWRTRLRGASSRERLDQSQMANTRLLGLMDHQFSSDLMLRTEMMVQASTGYQQTVFSQPADRGNFRVQEAKIHYKPKYISLEAGILNQDFYASPLLFNGSDNSFPAAREGLFVDERSWGAGLFAQQAIPTSTLVSNPAGTRQATPRLAMESAVAYVRPVEDWFLEGAVHRYTFLDLPSSMAAESRRMGSTVTNPSPNAEFSYGYQGFLYGVRTHGAWGRFRPSLRAQLIQNQLTPSDRGLGHNARLDLGTRLDHGRWLIPFYEIYRSGSDTVPAAFASGLYGGTNRQGWGAGITLREMDWNVRLTARYSVSDVITVSPVQSRLETAFIQLETDYAQIP